MVASVVFYSCEEDSDAVIDPSFYSPLISNPVKSKDTILTTSSSPLINFVTSINVNTNQGAPISNVECTVFDPQGNTLAQSVMNDNGSSGDSTPGDAEYTAVINITSIECLIVGNYRVEYLAENSSGLFSNLIASELKVINTANVPPVITSTNLPDTVTRPASGSPPFLLTISAFVSDSDGLCDIKDVSFVTTRPNGDTLIPIPMANNGNGQFVFSNQVSFSSDPTSYGYFKYKFTARDNSNILSAPVIDSILFLHP